MEIIRLTIENRLDYFERFLLWERRLVFQLELKNGRDAESSRNSSFN